VRRPKGGRVSVIIANAEALHISLEGGYVGFAVVLMDKPVVLLDGVPLGDDSNLVLKQVLRRGAASEATASEASGERSER
jgi:hypothetical protein